MLHPVGAKVPDDLFKAFEEKRVALGLTKSEAVRMALRLFVENEAPGAVNRGSEGCERGKGDAE